MPRYHIVIEGTDEGQMQNLWEEIQNKYSLYDNCVFEECAEEDSVISEEDRCVETGRVECKRPAHAGEEPKEDD